VILLADRRRLPVAARQGVGNLFDLLLGELLLLAAEPEDPPPV